MAKHVPAALEKIARSPPNHHGFVGFINGGVVRVRCNAEVDHSINKHVAQSHGLEHHIFDVATCDNSAGRVWKGDTTVRHRCRCRMHWLIRNWIQVFWQLAWLVVRSTGVAEQGRARVIVRHLESAVGEDIHQIWAAFDDLSIWPVISTALVPRCHDTNANVGLVPDSHPRGEIVLQRLSVIGVDAFIRFDTSLIDGILLIPTCRHRSHALPRGIVTLHTAIHHGCSRAVWHHRRQAIAH